MSTWDRVGQILAHVGVYTVRAALWASKHPEVVQVVAVVAGHPEVAQVLGRVAGRG